MSNKALAEGGPFAAVETELQALSRWLYEHPELAYVEYEASRRLSEFLSDHGFDVTYPSHGLWRMPPESSYGYDLSRCVGSGMLTSLSRSSALVSSSTSEPGACFLRDSMIW